jgi:hypothetical protein
MTKFNEIGKIREFNLTFLMIWFWQFEQRKKENMKTFKFRSVWGMERKGETLRSINDQI